MFLTKCQLLSFIEVAPPEFEMTFTERQTVDERKMSKYDWARTSYAQEQNGTTAFLTDAAATGPKLIMDCSSSDDESESSLPPGDVAINMGEITGDSDTHEESGESTSEDESVYDPRNHECEDNLVEDQMEQGGSGEHENEVGFRFY